MNNRFELGKFYQHHSGSQMHICGIADTVFNGLCFIAENGYNREMLSIKIREWENHKLADGELRPPKPGTEGWAETFTPITMSGGDTQNYFEIPASEFIKNNTSK